MAYSKDDINKLRARHAGTDIDKIISHLSRENDVLRDDILRLITEKRNKIPAVSIIKDIEYLIKKSHLWRQGTNDKIE